MKGTVFKIRRFSGFVLLLAISLAFVPADAHAAPAYSVTADGVAAAFLTDDSIYTYKTVHSIEISSSEPLYGVYIKYDRPPGNRRAEADGVLLPPDGTNYLHSYIALDGVKKLLISYESGASVADVFAFEDVETPPWVQKWEPTGKADILVCPTHSDDDQLYFAGLIPWCAAKGYKVQVVYLTNHWNTHDRPHELLEGLWHCGVKCYPIISDFPDLYSMGIEDARAVFGACGCSEDDFVNFYLDVFRRCEPLVVVSHDFNGEYGHGAHMLNAAVLVKAVELSAEKGLWDVPKTYVHLWGENASVFNWDEPLDAFGGKSAFNISQEGFDFHKSQHIFTGLLRWLNGTEGAPIEKASQIGSYSPCRFGLYRSTVGADTEENPLFQNLCTYRDLGRERELLKKRVCFLGEERRRSLLENAAPFRFYLPRISAKDKAPAEKTQPEETSSEKTPSEETPPAKTASEETPPATQGTHSQSSVPAQGEGEANGINCSPLWLLCSVPAVVAVFAAALTRKKRRKNEEKSKN